MVVDEYAMKKDGKRNGQVERVKLEPPRHTPEFQD
jgi:hypothetical protein